MAPGPLIARPSRADGMSSVNLALGLGRRSIEFGVSRLRDTNNTPHPKPTRACTIRLQDALIGDTCGTSGSGCDRQGISARRCTAHNSGCVCVECSRIPIELFPVWAALDARLSFPPGCYMHCLVRGISRVEAVLFLTTPRGRLDEPQSDRARRGGL